MPIKYEHPGSVRKALNYRCYLCGAVFTTPQGINGHLHNIHGRPTGSIKHGKDWGVTSNIACHNKPLPVSKRKGTL